MGEKKMGRPTDNPKNVSVKFQSDNETFEKLKECSEKMHVSRAEVIRQGIHKVHNDLEEK
ncbi:ribbon-helix-helix domain-containing protein [Clostridium sp. D33t1_170424_F3]|uniref:ribbon-helix-helix domain-containing protein n=1 Tax=Clostridium sp. D33t1_170424_F3 TaxID=2787099 RepID=UPI0018AA6630|nr:ribbon-helix-helix domain-containing protein [Clostridium sp. D33t1_170424_F3]